MKRVVDEINLSSSEITLYKSLANLLKELGMSDGVIVDQFAYRLIGINIKLEQNWINIVVDKDKLSWTPKQPSLREISLVNHPRYELCEKFRKKFKTALRIIPEDSQILKTLSYQYLLPFGKILNVAYPIKNIQGFTGLVEKYIAKEKLEKGSFAKKEVLRWIRNTQKVLDYANSKTDRKLIKACQLCLKNLNTLYELCVN